MMFTDYHTHTVYSNHGQGHPLESARAAVEVGLVALGFSEHFPLPIGFDEPTDGAANMHWDQIEAYVAEVREAQAEYGSRLKILLGYEVDYLPTVHDQMLTNLAAYPADYYVGSVHIIDRFRQNQANWLIDYNAELFEEGLAENGGIEAVYTRYYELIREFAGVFGHQIVGHLDLIKKFNQGNRFFDPNSPHYLSQVEATLDVLRAKGKIIEVSTAGIFRCGEIYPADPILQMILHRRIPICLNSDAHRPEHLAREFPATWQHLLKLGFEQLTQL